MNESELKNKLNQLLAMKAENEIVEFKEANSGYDIKKLGKYFSALCNEANLLKKTSAWLVFGIEDKQHRIVGTKYRTNIADLDNLKKEIADKTSNRITFIEIYELNLAQGRVILFRIPPAPKGLPIAFDGHYYGRDGESLVALNMEEIERIRNQSNMEDWSVQIIPDATIEDLDNSAIQKAITEFEKRNPKYVSELHNWDTAKFLDKAKLTIKGKITSTALILLGKEESEHFLGSSVKIRWNLRTINNQDKSYEVFSIPLILAVDKAYNSIRNLKYIYQKDGTIFPDEYLRYDPFTIRELLNNAIAHQDYTKKGYINVVEFEDDHLVISNYGSFLPKSVEDVVLSDTPEENYRNPFLVAAMKNLDMIETQGGGIRKLFNFQRRRFFPMPDYVLSDGKCKVSITGKITDESFARILNKNPDLSLEDVLLLDKVQKQKPISTDEYKFLKKNKFIKGRKGNISLSFNESNSVHKIEKKDEGGTHKSVIDAQLKKIILEYVKINGQTKRNAIDNLIIPRLSDKLKETQKKYKIGNLLSSLRNEGKIKVVAYATWEVA